MRSRPIVRAVGPYLAAVAVLLTAAVLVAAILFTELSGQWALFLSGVLIASVLSMASRAAEAQWTIARGSIKLLKLQEKLAKETQHSLDADRQLEAARLRLHLLEELLPIGVAHVGRNGSLRFHNRAFREHFGVSAEQVDGRFFHEMLGVRAHAEAAPRIERVQAGQVARFTQEVHLPDGSPRQLSVIYLPYFDADRKQDGFFALLADAASSDPCDRREATSDVVAVQSWAVGTGKPQDLHVEAVAEQRLTSGQGAIQRILSAFEQNEFTLYCQRIAPLSATDVATHYEVFIRLMEEEEGMMPPGAFFPLVEQYGLMPQLDRWVVQHVVDWLATRLPGNSDLASAAFFINLAPETLQDADFPDFVSQQLERHQVPPARLCFEIPHTLLVEQLDATKSIATKLTQVGCALALCGFGRDGASFARLHGLGLRFLKIDSSLLFDIERDPGHLARVAAIAKVAASLEVKTVAELVESEASLDRLRSAGVNYAQGFAVATPRPLADIA